MKKQGDETIKAPTKLPKNHWSKTVFSVILMTVWVAAVIIASQILVGHLMLWMLGADDLVQPIWTAVYSAVSYVVAILIIILVPAKALRKKKINRSEMGLGGWPTWTDIGLAPVGFIVYMLLAAGLLWVFTFFPWFDAEQAQDVGFYFLASGTDRIVAFLALVVVAPIAEEIIFRGWLYGKMRNKLLARVPDEASMVISIILVSLLFGIMHMQWNVGVNVFAMSVVLCALREVTGTVYAGILLHMIKNGLAFYLLYVLNMS